MVEEVEITPQFMTWLPESSRDATERAMAKFPTLFICGTWQYRHEVYFGLYTNKRVDLSDFWKLRTSFLANEKGK
jgi:hypothetical protein